MREFVVFIFICLLTLITVPFQGEAASSLNVGAFQKWKLDEQNGYLYFISQERELIFINTDSMEVKSRLQLDYNVHDLEVHNGFLYAASDFDIKKINIAEKKVVETYPLRAKDIAVGNNVLFYSTANGYGSFEDVYAYHFDSGKQSQLTNDRTATSNEHFYKPALTLDFETNRLYVGESDIANAALFVYDASTFELKDKAKNMNFWLPSRNIVVDGAELFFNGSILDKDNVSIMHGSISHYPNSYIGIEGVQKDYIISHFGIYDRHTLENVYEGYTKRVWLDSKNYLYVYDSSKRTISKQVFQPQYKKNVIETSLYEVTIKGGLIDWVEDKANKLIYAISDTNHKLYAIRESDMKVINEVFVGAKPVDLELYNDTLYISLQGTSKIAVVPKTNVTEVSYLLLDGRPNEIELANDYLFYSTATSESAIKAYHLQTNTITRVGNETFMIPTFKADRVNNVLYVSDTNRYESKIHSYDAKNLGLISDHIMKKHVYSDNIQIINGELFVGYEKVDRNNFPTVIAEYPINSSFAGRIFERRGNLLFTTRGLHKIDPFSKGDTQVFQDVRASRWSFREVNKAASLGIIKGYGEQFRPSNLATRAQAIVMLQRALHKEKGKLSSDSSLTNVVKSFVDQENESLQRQDYVKLKEVYEQNSIGSARTMGLAIADAHMNIPQSTEISYTISPQYDMFVSFKSDRYAEVIVSNLSYHVRLTKEGEVMEVEELVTQKHFLQKTKYGEWKVYRIETVVDDNKS